MSSLKRERLASGHTFEHFSDERNEAYEKIFLGSKGKKMVKLKPGGLVVPETFIRRADLYYRFEYQPTDVMVMTFTKCGTTWTQEILWTMLHNYNLDNDEASHGLNIRAPTLEMDGMISSYEVISSDADGETMRYFRKICPDAKPENGIFYQLTQNTQSPRVIKTHLPFSMLNPNLLDTCKVVFVIREPKDCCTSFLKFCRLTKEYEFIGTDEQFVNLFITDQVSLSPFWGMIKEGWERRNHSNMLILYYEDMIADITREIKKIDKFLLTNLSESQLNNISKYTSFREMQKRNNVLTSDDSSNPFFIKEVGEKSGFFFRKGIVGDHKNILSCEQIRIMDDWISQNTADMPGFKYRLT